MNMKTPLAILAVLAAGTHFAAAEVSTQGIVDNLQANGFTGIEVTVGPGQVKAEGYNPDGTKIEVVYDRSTGKIQKQEMHRVRSGESIPQGVEMKNGSEDFTDESSDDHDHMGDDSSDDHGDDHGMSSDDGPDHDSSDDHDSHDSSDDSSDSGHDDSGSDD